LVDQRRSQIVLGLDPDPAMLWPVAVGAEPSSAAEPAERRRLAAEAVGRHCRAAIEAAGASCVAVKPQLACFERLGADGWRALEQTVAVAHEHGLLVLADGKRGDVPVTARAYGEALVGETGSPWGAIAGLGADAFTANPLLGQDSLEPLLEAADAAGAGCFCLVRTSNPGAADVQDLAGADGPVHEALARLVAALGGSRVGACGLSSVGAVTGATRPELLARLRELMPEAIFLLPGVGAQGGTVDDLAPAFAPHPAGGLIAASRSIVHAAGATGAGADPAQAAAAAAEDLRRAAWALAC
jgi:orotidine-5'-phosphate decarboxylase